MNLNTEKARSELLIVQILADFKLLHRDRVSLFSGIDFNVDDAMGLKGRCDYVLARSPEQLALIGADLRARGSEEREHRRGHPAMPGGDGRAQVFNDRDKTVESIVYGAVTTGILWRFLRLDGKQAAVDSVEYPIQTPRKVFGILTTIARIRRLMVGNRH